MAGAIYDSFWADMAEGNIKVSEGGFYAMLVSADYVPDVSAHARRGDVQAHEVAGAGYAPGGLPIAVEAQRAPGRLELRFAGQVWRAATIRARAQVIYRRRGDDPARDELVFFNDFGADVTSTADDFSIGPSTITISRQGATPCAIRSAIPPAKVNWSRPIASADCCSSA